MEIMGKVCGVFLKGNYYITHLQHTMYPVVIIALMV